MFTSVFFFSWNILEIISLPKFCVIIIDSLVDFGLAQGSHVSRDPWEGLFLPKKPDHPKSG